MKHTHVVVLSFIALGLQSAAVQASPFPADAEASYNLPALETHADRHARMGEASAVWGVSKREVQPHDPFPFGGGPVDD